MTTQSHKNICARPAAVLFWLLVWQFGASLANRSLLIPIPTPLSTASALLAMSGQMKFWLTVGASLLRICLGFAAALVLGTVCALISARSEFFRILTSPLLQLIRAIPVASFTIVIFLWISRDRIPTVISFLTVFPIVWANIESGARSMDRRLTELAQVFGMKRGEILRKIILPGIRPFFTAAIAGGMGFAWKSGVAVEVICRTTNSLGDLLWSSKSIVAYDEVFAETLVIVVLSSLLQTAAGKVLNAGKQTGRAAAFSKGSIGASSGSKDTAAIRDRSAAERSEDSSGMQDPSDIMPRIDLDHVTFGYPHRPDLFTDYSLKLSPGSRICLSGASGIGKSTLIRLICGLEMPREGSVRCGPETREGSVRCNRDAGDLRADPAKDISYSVVFQEDLLVPHLTILQNVTLFAPGRDAKAAALLCELGLGEFLNALPPELSGGMKRRAALARALCHPFDILVLDEPFTGLDEEVKQRCFRAIRTAVQGRILILASHDPEEAAMLDAEIIHL